jgi:hypothetical protein
MTTEYKKVQLVVRSGISTEGASIPFTLNKSLQRIQISPNVTQFFKRFYTLQNMSARYQQVQQSIKAQKVPQPRSS